MWFTSFLCSPLSPFKFKKECVVQTFFKKSDIKDFFAKPLDMAWTLVLRAKTIGGGYWYDQFLFQIRNDINRKTICFLIGQLLFITELDQKDISRKFHRRRAHMDYVLGSKCSTIPSFHLYSSCDQAQRFFTLFSCSKD